MLTGRITRRLDIPHEPGEWMEFRMLSGKQLDEAREVRTQKVAAMLRAMGGEVLKAVRDEDESEGQDPLLAFDVDTLLYHGIVGWSYDAPVTRATIDQLDARTREWAARVLATWHVESEADRKNG